MKLVEHVPAFACMPWHARGWSGEPEHGSFCYICDREIAKPERARNLRCACIYCAMELGFIPAVESELGGVVDCRQRREEAKHTEKAG